MLKSPMGKKKKAADFYFTKKTAEVKTIPQKNDLMMSDVVAATPAPSKVSHTRIS
jgi:hypothetical protein